MLKHPKVQYKYFGIIALKNRKRNAVILPVAMKRKAEASEGSDVTKHETFNLSKK